MTSAPTILQPALPGKDPRASIRLTLPMDLRQQAVRRLYYVACVMGAIWSLTHLGQTVFGLVDRVPEPSFATTMVRMLGIVGAGVMIVVAGSRRLSLSVQSDVGLGFEIIGAAVLVGYEQTLFPEIGIPLGPVSLVSLWILLFRLFIPTSSGRALVAALLSAATVPLTLFVLRSVGRPSMTFQVAVAQTNVTIATALLGWLAARVIYRMGTEVSEARTLGRYRLEERLGSGGMGEVWRASHARLKRPAAIKLIDPGVLGAASGAGREETLSRFEHEAQATAQLSSPHTVTLYDYGAAEDGTLYYVMEYLDGLDLETLVERTGPVPPERAAHLITQVCHSLTEAHLRGLVHRDIKPANIFVTHVEPDLDFVKVLDFGLAKHVDPADRDLHVTRDGVVHGTPAFMPPEMVLGDQPLDARADVYMLGCTLYWLLTGRLVFEGKTAVAIMSKHLGSPPVPVSALTELQIPAALDELILQCLRKDPRDRPGTAAEIAARLSDIEFEAGWTPQRAERWWQVHGRSL